MSERTETRPAAAAHAAVAAGLRRARAAALAALPVFALAVFLAASAAISPAAALAFEATPDPDDDTSAPAVPLNPEDTQSPTASRRTIAGGRTSGHERHPHLRTRSTIRVAGAYSLRDLIRQLPVIDASWRHAFVRARLTTFDMLSKGGPGADRSILQRANSSPP